MESNHCGNSCRRNQCRLDIRIQVYYQPKRRKYSTGNHAELTTQKMIISDVFKSTKGNIPLINKNKFLVQYKTTVTAGLDVKKAKIKETDDEIRITIPHCTINEDSIKIKSSDLKIYDTNFAIMSIDKEAVIEVVAEAEEKAKKKAESDEYGFLDNADENAKKVIKGMFENVAGERKVVVEFK